MNVTDFEGEGRHKSQIFRRKRKKMVVIGASSLTDLSITAGVKNVI